ncbi:MAG: hypothetical protein HQL95_10970, partial [Magnetococcales bacterium]|nr:hypothetical protein [Magnetococcales bacterium]
ALLPLSSGTKRLVRLLLPRLVIGFGLLLFIAVAPPLEEGGPDHPVLLRLFVVVMFLVVIGHLWWLRTGRNPEWLMRAQCVVDPLLVVILVILTGSFRSPFLFLNGLVTLNAAILLGRRAALLTALLILLLTASALSLTTLLLEIPVQPAPALLGGLVLHGVVYFMTAFLGGTLAQRAAGLQSAYDRQTDSLADLAALHEQIVRAVPYGLMLVNNQGRVRAANPGAGEFVPSGVDALIGESLQHLDPALAWAVIWANGETVYVEVPTRERILGLNVTFLKDRLEERIGALLVIRDLSPMKRLERELAERERLAWIGRMSAGMAHEIRNPLAAILTAAQMLQPGNPREERLLTIILEEVTRLKQLTGDFLLFARGARAQRQWVGLKTFFASMEERARKDPRWGDRILEVELSDPELGVAFDPDHLRQIFWNLFLNAAQAAPEGRKVRVRGESSIGGGGTRLLMEDDGPGVDPGILSRLGEPFFTTRPHGSGLGLAVVRHLAMVNGADLYLSNGSLGGLRVELRVEGGGHGGDSGL